MTTTRAPQSIDPKLSRLFTITDTSPDGHTFTATSDVEEWRRNGRSRCVVTDESGREVGVYTWLSEANEAILRRDLDPQSEPVADEVPLSVVPPLGWVQDAPIPVAVTEGGVVLDLSAFLPDLIRVIRGRGFDTASELIGHLQAKGYATPHLSMDAAERMAADLGRAIPAAEEAGTVTDPPCGTCGGSGVVWGQNGAPAGWCDPCPTCNYNDDSPAYEPINEED